jgi:hypothetical protein
LGTTAGFRNVLIILWGLVRLGQPIAVGRHKLLKLLKWAVLTACFCNVLIILWGLVRLGQPIAVGRHKLLKLLKWAVFKHFLLGVFNAFLRNNKK